MTDEQPDYRKCIKSALDRYDDAYSYGDFQPDLAADDVVEALRRQDFYVVRKSQFVDSQGHIFNAERPRRMIALTPPPESWGADGEEMVHFAHGDEPLSDYER